jgi:riboflavin biosynthesis pyrimidine reductase
MGSVKSWRDVFAAVTARKTAAAIRAETAPYVTVLAHPAANLRPIATGWSSSRFGGPFYVREPAGTQLPACSLVFVRSADGNTAAKDPGALGGGATDYHVVYEALSRVAADAVLAGARTVHGGETVFSVWHPEMVDLRQTWGLSRHPAQIVATRRGVDLDRHLLFNVPDLPVILLTGSAGAIAMEPSLAARPWIRVVNVPNRSDLPRAFADLRAGGVSRISCVGGRSLAADLLALKLIDDLYLTTSARPGGDPGTPLPDEALNGDLILRKRGTGEDLGVVFEHFALRNGPASARP